MIDVPVEVKDALRDGRLKKNYRIVVLDDEGAEDFTIDNNNLVSESVSIDERMCSGNKIKFGLCEGSSLEFQYFGYPSILGKRLQMFIDVDYETEGFDYETVLKFEVGEDVTITEDNNYRIYSNVQYAFNAVELKRDGQWQTIEPTISSAGTEVVLDLLVGDIISIMFFVITPYDIYLQKQVTVKQIKSYAIPMGFFDVQKCSRQASTGIIKVTAYNKLMSDYLDAKANELMQEMDPDSSDGQGITAYALINNLLSDYYITPKEETQIKGGSISPYLEHIVYVPTFKENGSNLTYNAFGVYLYNRTFELNPSKGTILENIHDYIVVLQSELQNLFASVITGLQDPETVWQNILNSDLYAHYFGIGVEFVPSTTPPLSYYSLTLTPNSIGILENLSRIANAVRIDVMIPWQIQGIYVSSTIDRHTSWGWENSYGPDRSVVVKQVDLLPLERVVIPFDSADVTLRELQSAVFESSCQFGQLDRVTDLFSGVELNHSRLYPLETLYPDNALYPVGAQASATKSMYSQLWADEGNVRKWRNLIITYKGLDDNQQEKDLVYTAEVNSDGTDDYDCSDNWLFRNLVWTRSQIRNYADTMVAKMQDMTWFPFEMWCPGLPYLETGDEIEIPLGQNSYTSYVLQRQLKGIQNLQDTYINGTLDIF